MNDQNANHYVPLQDQDEEDVLYMLQSAAKKDDDMTIDYVDPTGYQHQVTIDERVLHDLQRHTADGELTLTQLDDVEDEPSLPFLWVQSMLEDREEIESMVVPMEVIYLMYLGNALFMGGIMLCLGTFWMFVFERMPYTGQWEWIRYTVMGVTWGIFACLYCMLMWIDTKTIGGSVALLLSWQVSAMLAVASLAAFLQHQAPLHVCAIVFLQSLMVVVYTYTQKRDPSAMLVFLLMFMVTLIQWAVSSFVFGITGVHSDGHVPSMIVLIIGMITCVYHAFHIRYIAVHNVRQYFLSDKSRLEALRDLYTDGLRWMALGVLEAHAGIAEFRRRWCCRWCGGRITHRTESTAVIPMTAVDSQN